MIFKQPERLTLSDFLMKIRRTKLLIPVFQRNYTWSFQKETSRFLNDLKQLIDHPDKRHFFGIFLLNNEKTGISIVDGQQRITTLFLYLLAVHSAAIAENDKETADETEKDLFYDIHDMTLRITDSAFAADLMTRLYMSGDRDLSEEEKESSFYENYSGISVWIRKERGTADVRKMFQVLERMDIMVFPLSSEDNVQEIYESINSAGVPLTSADLIRNFILMNHPSSVQERWYRMYWKPLEEAYPDSSSLEEFFRYYLAEKTFGLLNRKDVYEGFKKYWYQAGEEERILQDIDRSCRYYHAVFDGHFSDPETEEAFADYRTNGSHYPAPVFMAVISMYEDGKIKKDEMIQIVRIIDTYMTRRMLCGMDTVSLSRYFPTLLRTVLSSYEKKRGSIVFLVRHYLIDSNRGGALAMPSDRQIKASLQEIDAYSLINIRSVLERLEHFGSHARVDTSDLNIEHIMPQHPSSWWLKHSGTKDEDEYSAYVNMLGNLTLCAEYDNTRMGNEDFAFKKRILASTSHIRLNEEILKKKTWNKNCISRRTEEMAEKIIQIWPYNTKKGKTKKEDKKVINNNILTLNGPTVTAHAIAYDNGKMEVLPGTVMKSYGQNEMKKMKKMFRSLVDQGILTETGNGKAQFSQSWVFENRNEAAQFLMHRGGDNASRWVGESEQNSDAKSKNTEKNKEEKKAGSRKSSSRRSSNRKADEKKSVSERSRSAKEKKSTESGRKKRDPRNPRGIKPQNSSAVEAAGAVKNPAVVRFAGMGVRNVPQKAIRQNAKGSGQRRKKK